MRKGDQGSDQAPVYRFGPLSRLITVHVKKQRPVHGEVADRSETHKVRKELNRRPARPQYVSLPNLRVAVSVSCVGEFYRNTGIALRLVESRAVGKNGINQAASDQSWQKIIDDDPLVMPGESAPCRVEEVLPVGAFFTKSVY